MGSRRLGKMVFGMNKGIFDGTYLKHPTRSGACQSSGATKTLDGKTIVGFIYTFSSLFCSLFRISILYSKALRYMMSLGDTQFWIGSIVFQYVKHPTRSGACQSSGAKKVLYHGQTYLQLPLRQWGASNVYLLKQDYLKKNWVLCHVLVHFQMFCFKWTVF